LSALLNNINQHKNKKKGVKMKRKYSFAGFPVVIDSIYDYVHRQCTDYIFDGEADSEITIKTSRQDIENEREKARANDIIEQSTELDMSDEQLESLAVYRRFCDEISTRGCILIRGCAVSAYNKAYLFTGDSGVGKSTHARLWLAHLGSSAEIINGNNPILRITGDTVYVYGTPWCGREGINQNKCIPLNVICILTRDKTNHIEEISISDGYAQISNQCYRPANLNYLSNTISNLNRILKNVKLYSLGCNVEPSAAVVAYEGMKNKVL